MYMYSYFFRLKAQNKERVAIQAANDRRKLTIDVHAVLLALDSKARNEKELFDVQ